MTESSFQIPKRAVTLVSAAALALAGMVTLATGMTAHATPGDPHQVWVCKFVQKPHQNEILKSGKNPIFVDWASLTGKSSAPHVGDTFSDAQDKSVVVQIGGSDPGIAACGVSTPPTSTPPTSTPPTTPPTSTPPTTTPPTSTPATSTVPPTTTPPTTVPPTTPSGGGGGETPGAGAPATGGAGDTNPLNGIVGTGLLLASAGLVAGDLTRRRRHADHG
ncbi:hypothetical protein ACWEOW_06140 [Monashia sp. NPDC004114]